MKLKNKRAEILEQIQAAALKSRRALNEIQLVAVCKKQLLEKIQDMHSQGQKVFAENYVQEFLQKRLDLPLDIEWHFIGPLQKNKIGKIVGLVSLIHSVHTLELAQAISQKSKEKNLRQKILLQVNLASEDSKSGMTENELKKTAQTISELPGVQLCGLMSMPPLAQDPEDSRQYFRRLSELKKELQKTIPTMRELSMGTTQDFAVAIEEGATLIRVGEALFGSRSH